ncbi:molybdopterin cofactor-binding domain-containing protein [Desulforhopalus singaporensis]
MRHVGRKIPKIDGIALVKGAPAYTSDLDINNNALTVKLLRSPHASAEIVAIDKKQALAVPGVECILTYEDVPDTPFTLAGQSFPEPSPYDRRILDKWVRYVGDEVAIVAAVDEKTALEAIAKIQVTYNVLPPVLDPAEAIGNPVLVHRSQPHTNFDIGCVASKNIAAADTIGQGDVEAVLASCEVVVESRYRTQAQAHAMMETYRATTCFDVNNRLQVMSSTQIPFHVRRLLSRVLDIPRSRIKILKPRVGGGFGGKQTAAVEIFPAMVTVKTGKPARLVYTRNESFCCTTSRHAMELTVRLGSDRQGNIKAVDIYCLSDTGAYGEHAPTVFWVVGQKTMPLYAAAKAWRYHGHAVYTNKTPGGALRGYGATQGTFALESAINELAEKLAMDPAELRLHNLIREKECHGALCGSAPGHPARLESSSLAACIERGKELVGWQKNYPCRTSVDGTKRRGYGMAVTMQGSGIAGIDTGSVTLKLNEDGFFTLAHGASDMGQGSDTVLCQLAADVLEVELEQVVVTSFDLDTLPYDPGAYASSGAYVTGNAALRAALEMKEKMCLSAARLLEVAPDEVQYRDGRFLAAKGESLTLSELAGKLCSFAGKEQLVATGTFGGATSPPPFVAGFAEVEVDLMTGQCDVVDYVALVDCGTVLNKNLARIQVEGGIVMGIGLALYEDVRYSARGRLATGSFMEYKIPSRQDVGEIRVEFIESHEPTGPFGAKSIGEVVCNTPAPAIVQAIYNATGYRCRQLPATAEKILLAPGPGGQKQV